MRLIKISANKPGFKTTTFNPHGLSLIVGVRSSNVENEEGRSYNGVGKSLLAELIHFCLGSSQNKAFKEHLPTWEFSLDIESDDYRFRISRETDSQNQIALNEKRIGLRQLTDELAQISFIVPEHMKGTLSFRSLIPRFIRRGIEDYNSPKETSGDKEPFSCLVRNLFLLGIDTSLAEKKHDLRKKQLEIDAFSKNFKQDPYIREYYTGNKDASLQAKHLEEQIHNLEDDLSKFKVAEDYYTIEKEANRISSELKNLKNKKTILDNAISNIDKSLQTRADIPREKVLDIYREMTNAFKTETLKQLSEIEDFHNKLLKNRIARLSQEKIKILHEKGSLEISISELNIELDTKLAYLSDKRALDQYVAVSSQRAELMGKLQKLRDYQALIQKSRDDLAEIQKRLAEETIKANHYLLDAEDELDNSLSVFADLARNFYPDSPAGITINNNAGENKTRYDFDVRIEADGSDGINAVKIFCYDLTILLLEKNHKINFIWHDSRLFSDIDPRQRAILFKLAHELTRKSNKQYIATVNQDQLDAMKSEFTEEAFEALFGQERVVLTLKDDGPESKLLGEQVDMHY